MGVTINSLFKTIYSNTHVTFDVFFKCKMAVTINSNTHEQIIHVKRKTQHL